MRGRSRSTRLLLAAVVGLLVLRYAFGVSWGARAAGALLLGVFIVKVGLATFRPLQHEPLPPVRDVVGSEGVPLYACTTCGTQLVLLREGKDKPPRHCGEPMTFSLVTDFEGAHDRSGPDYEDTVVPDYPPDDLR